MNRADILKGLSLIEIAYGNSTKGMIEETVELWYSYLKDVEAESYYDSVKFHIQSSRYKPTISEIMTLIKKHKKTAILQDYNEDRYEDWSDEEKQKFDHMVSRLRELSKQR